MGNEYDTDPDIPTPLAIPPAYINYEIGVRTRSARMTPEHRELARQLVEQAVMELRTKFDMIMPTSDMVKVKCDVTDATIGKRKLV